MVELHPRIEAELRKIQDSLASDGALTSRTQLQRYYDLFRREFGPEVLRSLDGQELLERMHAHGSRDSLVYWLEFKDDDVFPSIAFGSIAGGSALKFGVFRRAETGAWATKGIGPAPKEIPIGEAIEIARRHRDQLLAAVNAVATFPAGATDAEYLALQQELARVAPDVQDTAWGHKYLSLIFPDVLDDYHIASLPRYHLVRVLQLPPRDGDEWAEGRYVCAARFVGLAQRLDVPLHVVTTLLNRRHGQQRSYWRIGTTDDEKARRKYWPMMRDGNIVAVGWSALGDLSDFHNNDKESRNKLAALVQQHYPNSASGVGNAAGQILKFIAGMAEGDRVVAADGQTILGVGEVAGSYGYDPTAGFPHQRPVSWLSRAEWKAVQPEALRTTVGVIRDPRNQVEIERRILDDFGSVIVRPPLPKPETPSVDQTIGGFRGPLPRLSGIPGLVQSVLERKGQAILYGPPGTGKTYWALRAARELAALRAFGAGYHALQSEQRVVINMGSSAAPPLVRVTSFHPEYGYEDFIEGYRPRTSPDGSLSFELVPGAFRRLCTDAVAAPGLEFYLVIDEINRGDVPRIFGELLSLLERDKRGESFLLPASGEWFRVPPNVHVLGTMNTADRSIALLDVALRRRFGFVELMPDYSVLKGVSVNGLPLGAWLSDLNDRVRAIGGGDARNRQIGHAFLLGASGPLTTLEQLAAVLRDDIVPLLEEYCYDDFAQLADILGSGLVDSSAQRVRRELFDASRGTELIAALLSPKLATVAAVTAASDNATQDDSAGDDELQEPNASTAAPQTDSAP
jgi:5-methylcytosine-specific restriction protein B